MTKRQKRATVRKWSEWILQQRMLALAGKGGTAEKPSPPPQKAAASAA